MRMPLNCDYIDKMKPRDFGAIIAYDLRLGIDMTLYYDKKAGSQYRNPNRR